MEARSCPKTGTRAFSLNHLPRGAQFRPHSGPDLLEPHILRSLSNVTLTAIYASCAGCQVVAIDVDGAAWLFGRNDKGALGVPGVDAISENAPVRLTAQELSAPKGTRFVHAACGRSHTLLVGSGGQLWSAGANPLGQVRRGSLDR